MSTLRAFVGFSFDENDEPIVGKFLAFFKTMQDGDNGFIFDHARKAEPHDLVKKVLQKIEDKNLMIAICTAKEQVLLETPSTFISRFKKLKTIWKTSDWIIQEIGLAIGRKMDLILLIEEGVRLPGGLQGNREYIDFKRAKPEESFTRIMQMLQTLTPRESLRSLVASEPSQPKTSEDAAAKTAEATLITPEPAWTLDHYGLAFFRAVTKDDREQQADINEKFKRSTLALDAENVAHWEAMREWINITNGKGGRIENLRSLADKHPTNAGVLSRLAFVYSFFDEHEKAAKLHWKAAELCDEQEERLDQLKWAAISYHSCGSAEFERAFEAIVEMSTTVETSVLEALQQIFEKDGSHIALISLMERLAQLEPDHHSNGFSLAYTHSQHGSKELALYHYARIPYNARTALGHNNLGVVYEGFNLPVLAVSSFKKAKEMGETLAMSNLSRRYLDAGFREEARMECEEAIKVANYNNNINHYLARINDILEENRKKRRRSYLSPARLLII